jgi:hypothetical protein
MSVDAHARFRVPQGREHAESVVTWRHHQPLTSLTSLGSQHAAGSSKSCSTDEGAGRRVATANLSAGTSSPLALGLHGPLYGSPFAARGRSMAINRTALSNDFSTPIPNAGERTPALTVKEKVVMATLASHREGCRLTLQQLIAEMHKGRDAGDGAVEGLVDEDWKLPVQYRADDGTLGEVDCSHGMQGVA